MNRNPSQATSKKKMDSQSSNKELGGITEQQQCLDKIIPVCP